ncbi:MAG: L-histidine N(alpha)-methyltransferase [Actinobacteria bacterium]|nr:L-histidine N(alpha)-methyltransferase [Actinomycetota bacterium]MDQ3380224.1 L-histidine N(alpha)-methyltransferase [Actinomycetota bacterium]
MSVRVEVLVDEADRKAALRKATLRGLTDTPKQIPAVWLYDERGSLLFEEITRLPEYDLTHTERQILEERGHEARAFKRTPYSRALRLPPTPNATRSRAFERCGQGEWRPFGRR